MASGQKTKAVTAMGTTLAMKTVDSPETWAVIGDVADITDNPEQQTYEEATHLNSPRDDNDNVYREYVPGYIDPGTKELTLNFTQQDGQDSLVAAKGLTKSFRIDIPKLIYPGGTRGTRVSFDAVVGPVAKDFSNKIVLRAKCTLRVSGMPVESEIPAA